MSLTNKVAQFDVDSDLVNAWVHGPASGAGSTVTTESGTVRTPAKLIADNEAELQAVIDLTAGWANGDAITTTVLGGVPVASPAKLIADKEAEINVDAAGVLALSTAQADISTAQAVIATTQVTLATAQKTLAETAKTAAELAAVNALISAGSYVDEPTGRAAVADGVAFKVQGSGDIAAYEYRRVSAGSSTLIATYPSASLLTWTDEYRRDFGSSYVTDKIVEPSTNTANSVYRDVTVATSDVVEMTVIAKYAGRKFLNIYNNNGATVDVTVNLLTGEITNTTTESWALTSYTATALGNGWYKVVILKTVPTGGIGNFQLRVYNDSKVATYLGDGTSGIYIDYATVYNQTAGAYSFSVLPISNAAWTKLGSTVSADVTITRSETTPGVLEVLDEYVHSTDREFGATYDTYKLVEDSGASVVPSVYCELNWTTGTTYTVRARVKAAGRSIAHLLCNGGNIYSVYFNLSTGAITGVVAEQQAYMDYVGNGWYDITVVSTATATATGNTQVRCVETMGGNLYVGDGVSGIHVDSFGTYSGSTLLTPSTNPSDIGYSLSSGTLVAATITTRGGGLRVSDIETLVGVKTGAKLIEAYGAAYSPTLYRTVSFTNGLTYKFGGDFKAGERTRVNLYTNNYIDFNAVFNLETGTVESGTGATITALPNGWYRCEQTIVCTATGNSNCQIRLYPASGGHPYTANGVSGVYVNDAWVLESGVAKFTDGTSFNTAWNKQNIYVQLAAALYGGVIPTTAPVCTPSDPYVDPGVTAWAGKKVTVIGTSITAQTQYTVPLATNLGVTLTNAGISGSSIGANAHYGSLGIYNAIATIPTDSEVVLVEAGTNDFGVTTPTPLGVLGDTTTATFYGALYAAVVAIRTRAVNAKIVFLTQYSGDSRIPSSAIGYTNNLGNTIQQFQKATEEVAKYTGNALVDVGRQSGIGYFTGSIYMNDGLHLNSTGGTRYAKYVAEQLRVLARGGYLA